MTKRRQFTATFKAEVVLAMLSSHKSLAEVSREYRVKPEIIARWRHNPPSLRHRAFAVWAWGHGRLSASLRPTSAPRTLEPL